MPVGTVDTVVTEVGVFDIADGSFWIKELAPGVELSNDVLELVALQSPRHEGIDAGRMQSSGPW